VNEEDLTHLRLSRKKQTNKQIMGFGYWQFLSSFSTNYKWTNQRTHTRHSGCTTQ